jgi:hypothetical protein
LGDYRRFRRFAEFIDDNFRDACSIADVAGGQGELSFWLHELGRKATTIEPRKTALPRWIRKTLRRRAPREGRLVRLERIKLPVEEVDLSLFDLLVAMHPDQATEPALRLAMDHHLDFAIVPCCVYPVDGQQMSSEAWISYLSSLGTDIRTTALPFPGANTVLWRKAGGVLHEEAPS